MEHSVQDQNTSGGCMNCIHSSINKHLKMDYPLAVSWFD
jgi:hypothetical protein